MKEYEGDGGIMGRVPGSDVDAVEEGFVLHLDA